MDSLDSFWKSSVREKKKEMWRLKICEEFVSPRLDTKEGGELGFKRILKTLSAK